MSLNNTETDYEEKYFELEKELVQFKQKTLSYLEIINDVIDSNKQQEKQIVNLTMEREQLKEKVSELESKLKRTEVRLNALQNSKLGKLTKKYWSVRKKVVKGV